MAYKLDDKTIAWARTRHSELDNGITGIGGALESMQFAIESLMKHADMMDNQPESEMARDFAKQLSEKMEEMDMCRKEWISDRKALSRGINAYRRKGGVTG